MLELLHHVRVPRPGVAVMVRTPDESHVKALRETGATEVVPEAFETITFSQMRSATS